jgi:hypothetical protein
MLNLMAGQVYPREEMGGCFGLRGGLGFFYGTDKNLLSITGFKLRTVLPVV